MEGTCSGVVHDQGSFEDFSEIANELEDFEGLQMANHRWHGPHYSHIGARGSSSGRWLWVDTPTISSRRKTVENIFHLLIHNSVVISDAFANTGSTGLGRGCTL